MRFWPIIAIFSIFACEGASCQTIIRETFDTTLTGWTFDGTAEWSNVDSGGLSASGSAKLTNMLPQSTGTFSYVRVSRCEVITSPISTLVSGARFRLGNGATSIGSGELNLTFFSSANCMGVIAGTSGYGIPLGSGTSWSRNLFSAAFSPPRTDIHSILVALELRKHSVDGSVTGYFDDILLGINAAATFSQGRFSVGAAWKTVTGKIGLGSPVELTTDSAYFWFFAATNVELIVKILDACTFNDKYWVFAGGLTNVETYLTVDDNYEGFTRKYLNPQGSAFLPIQDTDALPSCPEGNVPP